MSSYDWLPGPLRGLLDESVAVWVAGGSAMVGIAAIALVMFGLGVHIWLRLLETGFRSVPESQWRAWIESPSERHGKIGALLDFVTHGRSLQDMVSSFGHLRVSELRPFERDLKMMRTFVSAAPLVGLLGTVIGMLSTFGALSAGSGGDQTMNMVAGGISEALITTMTGLVIALPGLFFQYQLSRGFERYRAFLAHLETVCVQVVHRDAREQTIDEARRIAKAQVAQRLRERLREGGRPEQVQSELRVAELPSPAGTSV